MKVKNKLISGAFYLSLGGVICKLLGAIYRIPLTNILGAEGIGLYQMAFPLYTILLTFSSTGVPSGISKLIAEGEDPEKVLKNSIKLFFFIGFCLSFLTLIFCKNIAKIQGNENAYLAYAFISPSVLLVSLISCFRGYYQGFSNMKPTAFSQVLEQVVKLIFGLSICYFLKENIILASAGATLAVTVSELITLIYFILKSKNAVRFINFTSQKLELKPIVKTVFPIMVATVIMPLIRTIDSFLILNLLGGYLENATAVYGLYSGAVESIISMPVSFCYALAITSIPIISKLKKEGGNYHKKSLQAVGYTLALSSVFAVLTFIFSPLAVKLLYSGLSDGNKLLTVNMLRLSCVSVLLLPLMQTLMACVNAMGKYKITIISGVISAVFKVIISIQFLKIENINIFGAIISDIFCYLVACFINLSYIIYSGFLKNKFLSKTKVQNV